MSEDMVAPGEAHRLAELRRREERTRQLRGEVDRLQLQTVMIGRTPMALIGDEIVRVGDRIGSFTVTAIRPGAVELSAEGNMYTLMME